MAVAAFLWLVGVASCSLRSRAVSAPTRRQTRYDWETYKNKLCDPLAIAEFRGKSASSPGLVIAGHGGSSTRGVQEMVTAAGTHYFGAIDAVTHDSLVTRWTNTTDVQWEVFRVTKGTDYKLESVPEDVRNRMANDLCRALLILGDMKKQDVEQNSEHGTFLARDVRDATQRMWALKEPWLRFIFPFFDGFAGTDGYKFLHVTRDVRNIHQLESETNEYGLPDVPDLDTQLQAIATQAADRYEEENITVELVRRFARVAYTWATIEVGLKHSWKAQRPDQYLHVSEKMMSTPEDARSTAMKVATFLGLEFPSDEKIDAMSTAFQTSDPAYDFRWHLMNMIINLDAMSMVREALREFDYSFGIRED